MGGLLIEYRYDGDEAVWQNAVESFIKNIAADARLRSSFRYHVFVKEDGISRVHVPSWDSEETLKHLQISTIFLRICRAYKELCRRQSKHHQN